MARKRFILDKWLEEKKLDKILPGGGYNDMENINKFERKSE